MNNDNLKDLIEQFDDVLGPLYEQANHRDKMQEHVESLGKIITEHVCKIIYLRHKLPDTVHHWCAEIAGHLNNIREKDMKGGKFKVNTLFKWLCSNTTAQVNMTKRRMDVAKAEKLPNNCCKPVESNDYTHYAQIMEQFCEIIILTKQLKRNIQVKDIEDICEKVL